MESLGCMYAKLTSLTCCSKSFRRRCFTRSVTDNTYTSIWCFEIFHTPRPGATHEYLRVIVFFCYNTPCTKLRDFNVAHQIKWTLNLLLRTQLNKNKFHTIDTTPKTKLGQVCCPEAHQIRHEPHRSAFCLSKLFDFLG